MGILLEQLHVHDPGPEQPSDLFGAAGTDSVRCGAQTTGTLWVIIYLSRRIDLYNYTTAITKRAVTAESELKTRRMTRLLILVE